MFAGLFEGATRTVTRTVRTVEAGAFRFWFQLALL
jgi:hypothetical protein